MKSKLWFWCSSYSIDDMLAIMVKEFVIPSQKLA